MKAAYQCIPLISIFILLGSSRKTVSAQAALLSIAKPNCKDSCGDVKIPFPWGSGSGCFFDKWHEIECREVASSHTKVPFLTKLGVEVIKFEVVGAYGYFDSHSTPLVTIRMAAVKACTTNTHHKLIRSALDLKGSPYFFSSIHNVFVMEGCSGSAALVDDSFTSNFTDVGCATICQNNNTAVETNNCYGVKCCQTPLQFDLQSYQVHFYRHSLSNEKLDRRNCLLATLMGNDYLDQYAGKLSSYDPSGAAPVTLTWSWPRNPPPHYNPNTATCDFDDIVPLSWICYCHVDHTGSNPYVYDGCQVPESCQGCPRSCLRDEDSHPYTYSCHHPSSIWTSLDSGIAIGVYAILAIAAGPLLLVFACHWLYYFTKQRRKAERRVKYFRLMLQRHQSSNKANGIMESTKLFTYKELDKATEHFNDNRVLGEGGQGTVYKGMLTDGRIVAIKKSKQMDETQMEQFINEVVILSQTNHRNVVKLLGCCLETEVPLLAYEYISNGTLHQHIHNPSEDVLLTWGTRLKIAVGSAGGIAYLHSSSSTPIYHRDIKSANILLDDQYGAKVSDFGSSKTIEIDQTHMTTLVQGTMGYLDPEYFESSVFTEKSDVYSFGVVLLELLTSKKPIFRNEEMEQKNLVSEFFFQMQQNNGLPNILDIEVVKDAKEEDILAFADLSKQCLNESGRLRPTMKEVVTTLEMILKSPVQTHTLDGGGTFADQGFDEVVMFDMDDAEFMSRSARVFR